MPIRRVVSIIILVAFISTSLKSPAYAQAILSSDPSIQALLTKQQGILVHLSPEFTPAHLQGLTIHPDNALQFDFLINRGDELLSGNQKRVEYNKLVKYFLASLTIPDEDQWVNLSPYEKNRIIKDDFGRTEMGRDLLAQDYILKQITSSLIYPEEKLGKEFWARVYERAYKEYGATNIPVNTFNKVWIIPDEAAVYESGNTVYVLRNHLKVMLEQDYLSKMKHQSQPGDMALAVSPSTLPSELGLNAKAPQGNNPSSNTIGSQIIREIILPELEKEVNQGKNFANLRQIYSGMILATWYKHVLKESLLGRIYANQSKVLGVTGFFSTNSSVIASKAKQSQDQIYQQYLKAFKKGVFNYIKEDVDKYTNETIPRKYFSGGAVKYPKGVSNGTRGFHDGELEILKRNIPPSLTRKLDPAILTGNIDRASIALNTQQDTAMTTDTENDQKRDLRQIIKWARNALIHADSKIRRASREKVDRFNVVVHVEPVANNNTVMNVLIEFKNRQLPANELFLTLENPRLKTNIPAQPLTDLMVFENVPKGDFYLEVYYEEQGEMVKAAKVPGEKKRPIGLSRTNPEVIADREKMLAELRPDQLIGTMLHILTEKDYKEWLSAVDVHWIKELEKRYESSIKRGSAFGVLGPRERETAVAIILSYKYRLLTQFSVLQHDSYIKWLRDMHRNREKMQNLSQQEQGQVEYLLTQYEIQKNVLNVRQLLIARGIKERYERAEKSRGMIEEFKASMDLTNDQLQSDKTNYVEAGKNLMYELGMLDDFVRRDKNGQLELKNQIAKVVHVAATAIRKSPNPVEYTKQFIIDLINTLPTSQQEDSQNTIGTLPLRVAAELMNPGHGVEKVGRKQILEIIQPLIGDCLFRRHGYTIEWDEDIMYVLSVVQANPKDFKDWIGLLNAGAGEKILGDRWKAWGLQDTFSKLPKNFAMKAVKNGADPILLGNLAVSEGGFIKAPEFFLSSEGNQKMYLKGFAYNGMTGESFLMYGRYGLVSGDSLEQLWVNQAGEVVAHFLISSGRDRDITIIKGEQDFVDMVMGQNMTLTPHKVFQTNPLARNIKSAPSSYAMNSGIKKSERSTFGGIDLNSANLNLQIKRDGKGVPLPMAQQDMAQLMQIQGFVPVIIEIKPAVNLPIISELQQKLQLTSKAAEV